METDWRKRNALQIAAQLPDDAADALCVVSYVKEIVEGFLMPQARNVLRFPDVSGGAAPSASCSLRSKPAETASSLPK